MISPTATQARPARRRGLCRTVAVAIAALGSTMLTTAGAHADSPTLDVTSTTTTSVRPNATTTLAGMGLTDSNPADTLQVTISTDVGTLTMPSTSGLTLAFGNHWSGDPSITFTGSPADSDSALAAVQLVSGNNTGKTAKIAITALVSAPGYVYSPANEHFYKYVASSGITWSNARTAAHGLSFQGQTGYLATIPNNTVNDLISSKIQGAQNVWFGGMAINTAGQPVQRTWQWADGPLAGRPLSYCSNLSGACDFVNDTGLYHSWAAVEPNNSGGTESAAVTNWQGSVGKWNDLSPSTTSQIAGYVAEFGDDPIGGSYTGVVRKSSSVAIQDVPGAPTGVAATRGNGGATVVFTAPAGNGSTVSGYTVTATPAGGGTAITQACATSPCAVTGLTNGTTYTVTVHATNGVGDGPESASTTVTPATVPGAPTDVTATRGAGSANVAFTAPGNGGAAITGYTVTATPAGGGTAITQACATSPCAVTGLTNGTTYTFTVHATNTVGDSTESDPSNAVTPATAPSAPGDVDVTHGDGSLVVTFTAPSGNGSDITGYTVTATPVGGGTPLVQTCSASPCAISGLTNGTTYDVTVQATNEVGASTSSSAVQATPATKPGAPADLDVARGDGQLGLSFEPPSSDGGTAIIGYEVSLDGGQTWQLLSTTGTSPLAATITGLANGTRYDVAVRAMNAEGPSTPVSAGQHTPAAAPGAPTGVTAVAVAGGATVSFTPPADNGSAITGYTVLISGGSSVQCAASPCAVTGLTNGTSYTFQVVATNDVGDSAASAVSGSVTPVTLPGAPTGLTLGSQDGSASVSFTAPASDGGTAILGYEVSIDGGAWSPLTTTGTGTLVSVLTGLTNGTSATVRVRAVNAVGSGDASDSADVTPAGPPSPPRSVTTSVRGTSATVTWQAPATDGGAPITGYVVTARPGGLTCTTTGATSCVITGLAPGATYTFEVAAMNTRSGSSGTGTGTAADDARATVIAKPDIPLGVTGRSKDRSLTVTWSAPANPGTSPVTRYQISLDGGRTWTTVAPTGSTRLSATITPVRKGKSYPVQVRALNGAGAGAASSTVTVQVDQWFEDALPAVKRRKQVAVPKDPNSYRGRLRHTVATLRTRSGAPAYPAKRLAGRQLQAGEAVSFTSAPMFAFNQSRLTTAGRKQLKSIVKSLRYAKAVTCEGYADYGGPLSNERRLARERAHVVCATLRSYGARVKVRTKGYGSSRPVLIGGTPEQRSANRRVVVLVTRG